MSALGVLALEAGDSAAALAQFSTTRELDPRDPVAIRGLQPLGVKVAMPAGERPAGHP